MLALMVMTVVAATPATPVDKLLAAWSAGRLEEATAQLSSDVEVTWVLDGSARKRVPDATFKGHPGAYAFFESFLPRLRIEAGAPEAKARSLTFPVQLRYAWLESIGLEALDARAEVVFALDGRIRALRLTLEPASTERLLPLLPEAHKAWAARFYEEINRGNLGIIDELISSAFIQHSMWPTGPGREGLKTLFQNVRRAFPDAHFTLESAVAEGDTLAARMTGRYTHRGEFYGLAPTGKALRILKMDFFRFLNGRCIEHWDSTDRLGLLQQLGVVPPSRQWTRTQGYDFR